MTGDRHPVAAGDAITADNAPMSDSFFVPFGEHRYAATALTRGPWDPDAQHAGPPAALLGYAIEHRDGARDDMRVGRISFTITRPVPIAPLEVRTRVTHGGRGTAIVEATLAPVTGDEVGPIVMRAEALLIRVAPSTSPAFPGPERKLADPATVPESLTPFPFDVGYHTAMETRYAEGSFRDPGPAAVWFRMRHPLVVGCPIDPLSRVLTAADSGSGVSQVLSTRTHLFVNPELTVHLHRYPAGEWVCLDSVTTIDSDGIGLAETALSDESGRSARVPNRFTSRRAGHRRSGRLPHYGRIASPGKLAFRRGLSSSAGYLRDGSALVLPAGQGRDRAGLRLGQRAGGGAR